MLIWVDAPRFSAGFVIENGKCVRAAPILSKQFLGKDIKQCRERARYLKRYGWKFEKVG